MSARKARLAPPSQEVMAVQESLRDAGLPLFLEPRVRLRGLAGRCAPALLALVFLLAGLDLGDALLSRMTSEQLENPQGTQLGLILLSCALILLAPLVWILASVVLRRLWPRARDAVGVVALVAVVFTPLFLPTTPTSSMIERALVAAVVVYASYLGLGSMTVWAARRSRQELSRLGSLVSRVLPVLTLTLLFSFYNAEIWQVTAQLSMRRTWAVVAVLGVLGVALTAVTSRDEVTHLLTGDPDGDGPRVAIPLRRREMFNVVTMIVLITLIQVTLLGVLVFVFYVAFGVLSVTDTTAAQWIGSEAPRLSGTLAFLPISRPLVQVSLILSGFAALSFVATASTDPVHRATFVEPALAEVREGLLVRERYLALRGQTTPATETPAEQP